MTGALILDRDGVINEDRGYVYRKEDMHFIDGIFDLGRAARDLGMRLVVVTNQAGIGRLYYSEDAFQALSAWMCEEFIREGILIDRVYHCPYHPVHGIGTYRKASFDRKPNPGMILAAQRDFALDLVASVFVGDRESDIEAGARAGVGATVLFDPAGNGLVSACSVRVSALRDVIPLLRDQRGSLARSGGTPTGVHDGGLAR
ncbi:MAG: HAD family hydrolase [Burkholderiales bacterium]|nr:HAD family hydrolase [Burkholderiales bacterium]